MADGGRSTPTGLSGETGGGLAAHAADPAKLSVFTTRSSDSDDGDDSESFVYLKYWKPRGVTCTTDRTVRGGSGRCVLEGWGGGGGGGGATFWDVTGASALNYIKVCRQMDA